jgi:hypothetical protein
MTLSSPTPIFHHEDHTATIEISSTTPPLNRIAASFYGEP